MRKLLGLVIFLGFTMLVYGHSQQEHMWSEGKKVKIKNVIATARVCPVMGNPASEEYSYTYKGKTYYFCCPVCVEKFKKNPEKYISRIKEFELEAYQFSFEPQIIKVKKGDIVKLIISSRDVGHGVYIPDYGINVTVKKNQKKTIEFIAEKTGEFEIKCSVYCGRGHGKMRGKLIVEE